MIAASGGEEAGESTPDESDISTSWTSSLAAKVKAASGWKGS